MTFRSIVLLSAVVIAIPMTQCSRNPVDSGLDMQAGDSIQKKQPPSEEAANCLSFPVIWSDGITKPLRGTFGQTTFDGPYTYMDDPATPETDLIQWYYQGDPLNEWQAESRNQMLEQRGRLNVSRVDWGDNLEAKSWDEGSVVRTEVVLFQDLAPDDVMTGYTMLKLNDASGLDEIWGTNTQTKQSTEATVYSGCARLTIQKLALPRDDPSLTLTWNATTGEWEGNVAATIFNGGVWGAADGPGFYSAEINVQGKLIYGYNWYVSDIENAPGDYRLTFSLDNTDASPPLNTYFTDATTIVLPAEEVVTVTAEEGSDSGEPDLGGGVAVVAPEYNLTYIDVRILPKSGGGGKRR